MRRTCWITLLLFVCSLAIVGIGTSRPAAAAGVWRPAGALIVNRHDHAAALLQNGQVLVVGGVSGNELLGHAERYDPATNRWSFAGNMHDARINHTATTLADGRVLVIGGSTVPNQDGPTPPQVVSASTEIYDPAIDRWSAGIPLGTPREGHTATLLGDGRVLVVGGMTPTGGASTSTPLATAELYDPRTNAWSPTGPLAVGHAFHTAARLANGQVLVIGGRIGPDGSLSPIAAVERFDPATNSWHTAQGLPVSSILFDATLLADGRVLAVGSATRTLAGIILLYDPVADTWIMGGAPTVNLVPVTATLLPSGRVLITGGRDYQNAGEQGLAALYDPATDTWATLPDMRDFRVWHTATALNDGRVLIAGGATDPIAELYVDDSSSQQCFPETGKCLSGRFLAYWLAHGGLAVNGYPLSGEIQEKLEDGNTYTVQYLERVRLEYHPEVADLQYQVLLGQFGRQIHPADPPAQARTDARFFPETGHNLGGEWWAGPVRLPAHRGHYRELGGRQALPGAVLRAGALRVPPGERRDALHRPPWSVRAADHGRAGYSAVTRIPHPPSPSPPPALRLRR
jgi:hypothetical protein